MNKLFTKIAALFLGMAMAVGVGVAVTNNQSVTRADADAGDIFELATSISNGDLITFVGINSSNYYSMAGQASNNRSGVAVTFSNDKITAVTTTSTFEVQTDSSDSSYWNFYDVSTEKYLYNASSSSKSYLRSVDSVSADTARWSVSIDGTTGVATVASKSGTRSYMRFNYNNGSTLFNCYASGQTDVYIYKKTASYTISYNNNGGSGTMTSTTGSNPAVASCTFTAPTGKHFDHWNTSATDDGTTYAVGATPKADLTLYAIWATNSYTVGGTITNGSLSSTANVSHGSALNITINPSSGHKLPTTLTSVTMGGSAFAGYTYNSGTGAFSIASVTGNVVIDATCPVDATTYTISGSITNGSLTGDTGEQVEGDDYVVQISPSALYKYPTSVTVTGAGEEDSGWEYDSSDGIVYIYGLGGNVTISATCPAASITSITVSGQKTAFTLGEDFSFGGTVKASYDDVAGSTNVTISTDLVNINSSAYDAFTESNSYTISVTLKSNGSISTSYTVSVTRKSISTTTTYVKVSASQSDWSGKYVILSSDNAYVMGTTITSSRVTNGTLSDLKNSSGNTISSEDTVIASGYTNYVYTIAKSGYYYTISPDTGTNAGKYLAGKSSKNQADFISDGTDDLAKWTITYSSGFVFENLGRASQSDTPANRYLRSNTTSGFACYSSTQSKAPHLFVKTDTPSGTKSLIRITATGPADNTKKEGEILTADDFTVTALYDTAESGTVTENVTVTSGATLVAGSNTVTLSYTEGDVTKTCQVTVVAAENTANLDGIIWNKEAVEFVQFEGTTIEFGSLRKHYDDESTVELDVSDCSVAVYTKSGASFTKDHDIANPKAYLFDLEDDNGKYLGVTYESYTLYSGKLSIVETIDDVYAQKEKITFTTKASETNPIAVGDAVVFAYDSATMEMDGCDGSKGTAASYTGNPAGTYVLDVVAGNASGTFAFKNDNNYLAWSSGNSLKTETTLANSSSWTISYSETDVTITNVGDTDRSIRFNTYSGQQRFCCYASSNTFPVIQVYKGETEWESYGDSIANTDAVQQKAVLDFIADYTSTVNAICLQSAGGTTDTAALKAAWNGTGTSGLTGRFATAAEAGQNFKDLFKYGYSNSESSDPLKKMLASYNWIYAEYGESLKLTDFLHVTADRPEAPTLYFPTTSIFGNIENGNMVAIVVIVSVVSLTAIGGYFFLKKRREQN